MATFVPNLHSGTAASILAPSTALASNPVHAFLLPGDHSLTHSGSWLSAALLRPFSLAQPGEGEISLIIFLQNTPRVQHWRVSDLLIYWLCVMWVDVAYMSCKWNLGGNEAGNRKPLLGMAQQMSDSRQMIFMSVLMSDSTCTHCTFWVSIEMEMHQSRSSGSHCFHWLPFLFWLCELSCCSGLGYGGARRRKWVGLGQRPCHQLDGSESISILLYSQSLSKVVVAFVVHVA